MNQGVFGFTQDKLNIYEALGLGGGLSPLWRPEKHYLIRHEGEKIIHYRLNLANSKIATKDYYYILPNDVIVVEPLKAVSSSYSILLIQQFLALLRLL